jgi:DNA-binding response OmpR family regulator
LEALKIFESKRPPLFAIVDWKMPNMNGIDLIKKIRKMKFIQQPYILMLTGKDQFEDIALGMKAGIDDYAIKPFRPEEMRVRIANGVHMVNLQNFLVDRNKQLEAAVGHIRSLQKLFPLCPECKKLKNDKIYILQLEEYLAKHEKILRDLVECPKCGKTKA